MTQLQSTNGCNKLYPEVLVKLNCKPQPPNHKNDTLMLAFYSRNKNARRVTARRAIFKEHDNDNTEKRSLLQAVRRATHEKIYERHFVRAVHLVWADVRKHLAPSKILEGHVMNELSDLENKLAAFCQRQAGKPSSKIRHYILMSQLILDYRDNGRAALSEFIKNESQLAREWRVRRDSDTASQRWRAICILMAHSPIETLLIGAAAIILTMAIGASIL